MMTLVNYEGMMTFVNFDEAMTSDAIFFGSIPL